MVYNNNKPNVKRSEGFCRHNLYDSVGLNRNEISKRKIKLMIIYFYHYMI